MPASRRHVLHALLAEAESRGWREFPCSERYLVTVVIRHRHAEPADGAGRRLPPISAATCHRALADLHDAGWIMLSREGCKIARRPRRWRITQPVAPPAPPIRRPITTGRWASGRRKLPRHQEQPHPSNPPPVFGLLLGAGAAVTGTADSV
jgi:hypothetical protein